MSAANHSSPKLLPGEGSSRSSSWWESPLSAWPLGSSHHWEGINSIWLAWLGVHNGGFCSNPGGAGHTQAEGPRHSPTLRECEGPALRQFLGQDCHVVVGPQGVGWGCQKLYQESRPYPRTVFDLRSRIGDALRSGVGKSISFNVPEQRCAAPQCSVLMFRLLYDRVVLSVKWK